MPERILSWWSQVADALLFAAIGIAIGLGQALRDRELNRTIVVGRAISTGGLAVAAGSVLILWPDLPLLGQLGVAALLASLGTSGLEQLARRYFQVKE